jgi:hypothetical protein
MAEQGCRKQDTAKSDPDGVVLVTRAAKARNKLFKEVKK